MWWETFKKSIMYYYSIWSFYFICTKPIIYVHIFFVFGEGGANTVAVLYRYFLIWVPIDKYLHIIYNDKLGNQTVSKTNYKTIKIKIKNLPQSR